MKLTIKVILVLLVAVVIALGVSYQLPKQSISERAMLMQAPPEQVYAYLENPTEWVRWCAWNKTYDPTMIQLFGGPMRGAGARVTWNGDRVGNRHMLFTKSESPSILEYEISQPNQLHKTKGHFELSKSGKGTLVRWHEKTELNNTPLELAKGAWQQYKSDKQMEEGLLALKALVQQDTKRRANR